MVASGEDFATAVIGDPWDFSQPTDYTWMFSYGFSQPLTLSNGVVTGQATINPTIQLHFEGITGALNFVGRNGVRIPIDPSRFDRISYRMRRSLPGSTADALSAIWFTGPPRGQHLIGARLGLTKNFDLNNQAHVNQSRLSEHGSTSQFHIYKLHLGGLWNPSTFPPPSPLWTDTTVRGLAIGLGNTVQGATIEVDWVRLTKQGTATQTFSWSGFPGAVTLTATNGTDTIQIYPDNGTSATTFAATGSFSWDYGFLPSGVWTITAANGATQRQITLTIAEPSVIHLTEPDASGGRDFASTVVGDAWDMTNIQDVLRYGSIGNVASAVYNASGLTGVTAPGNPDPYVNLLDDGPRPPAAALSVDANVYRHLTFTIEYDHQELDANTALGGEFGGVVRLIWRRTGNNGGPLTNTQDIVVLDGSPNTYSMDLRSYTTFGGDGDAFTHLENCGPCGTDLWTGQMAVLRIDPYESLQPRTFRLSNIKLAADDEPNGNGFFVVKWTTTAASGATVRLYYDTDTDPSVKTQIPGATSLAASAGQFAWHLGSLPVERYFVYAEVTGPGGTQGRYSTGPVRVASVIPPFTDSNSNGLSDAWEVAYGQTNPVADPDSDGLVNLGEFQAATDPTLPNTLSLPEGATGFFHNRVALANPYAEPADVNATFLTGEGGVVTRSYSLMPFSRLTINVQSIAGLESTAVSTVLTATRGAIVAERTLFWDTTSYYSGHTGVALTSARTRWYLAEGNASAFDTYILLANASTSDAQVTATFLLETGGTVVRSYTVPRQSRFNIYANLIPELVGKSFSTQIDSNVPISVERSMYAGTLPGLLWLIGHGSAGVPSPSTTWLVSEGRTGPFFDTYLLLANPGSTAATVTITYLLPGGSTVVRTYNVTGTSRYTIWVDGEPGLGDTDVSASIASTQPIIVERALYWPGPYPNWYEAHNSPGVTSAGTRWATAEGEVGGTRGFETYILLANPGATPANVSLRFLRATGAPIDIVRTVPARGRVTVSAAVEVPGLANEMFGVVVDSGTVPIVVENSMYWNALGRFWEGGTNTTATRLR